LGEAEQARIVRENNNGPAPTVKRFLAVRFATTPGVRRAYFVDVDYGVDQNTAVVIEFDDSVSASKSALLIKQFMDDVSPFFQGNKLSLDFLPLNTMIEVPPGIKPFYDRATTKASGTDI
jgi:hypothetical protein